MKVFITGVNGQLGRDVQTEFINRGYEVFGSDIQLGWIGKVTFGIPLPTYVPLDITCKYAVDKALQDIQPDVIIHCAAWTNVDGAEAVENRHLVKMINKNGTLNIAQAAKSIDAKMIYISTDYVFDGEGEQPWEPDNKNYKPLNYYGQTKLEGEKAVSSLLDKYFVVRTAWVFGYNGENFVRTMINVSKTHDAVRVVNDQIGTPTYTKDLARLLADMSETEKYGYYHATNEGGFVSWYEFCCEIFYQCGISVPILSVSTEKFGLSIAKRPCNSRLSKQKLIDAGFNPLPDWRDALSRYLKEEGL